MRNKRNEKISKISGAFRLLGKYQPMYYTYMTALILVSSAIPLAGVWLPKVIIEFLTQGKEYGQILTVVGLYVLVLSLANVIKNFLEYRAELSVVRFKTRIQLEIGKAAMNAQIKEIENASYKEEIILAGNVAGLSDIMSILQNLFSAAVTILGLSFIIVRVNLLFFLLVGFTLGLKIILSVLRFRYNATLRKEEAENNKVGNYIDYLQYYNEGAAKEVRVNNAQDWLFGKIKDFRDRMVSIQLRGFNQYNFFEALQIIAVAVQNIFILLVLSSYYIKGKISIADFSLYFSSVTLLSSTLSGMADHIFDFSQKLLYCGDFNKIIQMEKDAKERNLEVYSEETKEKFFAVEQKAAIVKSIVFENVSFSYPGSNEKVLQNVSFQLHCGERAMLVGVNGSGKTTIIKLLCKFYQPDSGKIYIDGRDIDAIPKKQYYSLIATVFQDFSLFFFPICENVSVRSSGGEDLAKFWNCLEKVKMDAVVRNLKEKEDTHISKLFSENGVEFSGGEKQRLGIARAVYKDAPILVLDEPAASLDVKMEENLYQNFYDMTEGKISLTVSHRLSQALVCNKIFVLDHGIICEEGTHRELMEKDGVYANMFRKQREAYII